MAASSGSRWKSEGFWFKVVFLVVFLFLVIRLTNYVANDSNIQNWVNNFGFAGIFFASVISGFNLVVPIPIATFVPLFLESGFEFLPVVLTISLGMTVGDLLSYWVGFAGRHIVASEKRLANYWFVKLLEKARKKYKIAPYFILFFFVSFVPIPNEVTVMPMGFFGYRMRIIIPILIVGNIIFNFWTAQIITKIFNFI